MSNKTQQYSNSAAFRVALERRLKNYSFQENTNLQQVRRRVSFDRLLARLFQDDLTVEWILKGGYAMELRLWDAARTTRDIDLSFPEALQKKQIIPLLQKATARDLGDFFVFEFKEPTLELEAPPYGGARYPVSAWIDNRLFTKFHLDIGVGDVVILPTEIIEGKDWLGFAGITPVKVIASSREQQFAEKLHAYTMPREDNSRVKDIVDMALLLRMETLDRSKLQEAIQKTFRVRRSHEFPSVLADPPSFWNEPYQKLAGEIQLSWTLTQCINEIRTILYSINVGQ